MAFKRGRRLFEGGVYLSLYGAAFIFVPLAAAFKRGRHLIEELG